MQILNIMLIVLLTFSYSILQGMVLLVTKNNIVVKQWLKRNSFMIWLGMIVGIYLLTVEFRLPTFLPKMGEIALLLLLLLPFMAQAKYQPHQSIKGIIAFCIAFPLGEELLFRGILLSLLDQALGQQTILIAFPILKEIDLRVLLSALLFAVMHLQYFQWKINKGVVLNMIFAFVFGIVFGNLVVMSESVLYGVLFHMIANTGAAYIYFKNQRRIQ